VNDLELNGSSTGLPCNLIPHKVRRLLCSVNEQTTGNGNLPETLTDLMVYTTDLSTVVVNPVLGSLVSNLPTSLKRLCLSVNYDINATVQLPGSLEVMQPIKRLSHLSHLSYLRLYSLVSQLEKGMLPSTLESLSIYSYDKLLLPDVLPNGLKDLGLYKYNQPLNVGVLPPSLITLKLNEFNQELEPFALPQSLKTVKLYKYSNVIVANVLPSSLTSLNLNDFDGSLEHAPQMNQLSKLSISVFDTWVTQMISNLKSIKIRSYDDEQLDIRDTSIQHLDLCLALAERASLVPNYIPKEIKTLKLEGIDIKSNDLIPTSCIELTTDIKDLDLDLIPSSTTHIYSNK